MTSCGKHLSQSFSCVNRTILLKGAKLFFETDLFQLLVLCLIIIMIIIIIIVMITITITIIIIIIIIFTINCFFQDFINDPFTNLESLVFPVPGLLLQLLSQQEVEEGSLLVWVVAEGPVLEDHVHCCHVLAPAVENAEDADFHQRQLRRGVA